MKLAKNKLPSKKSMNFRKIDQKMGLLNEYGLNAKQERFCQLYATSGEFFGNGSECYANAYGVKKTYRVAQVNASRLLSNAIICRRINDILEENGFNDVFVDKQLKFLLTQYADFSVKLGAIREYNKLKKRITEKVEMRVSRPFESLTDEELAEAINEGIRFLRKK